MRPVTVRIACVQLRARAVEMAEYALDDALAGIAASASCGAELVVLPECTYPGYVLLRHAKRVTARSTERALARIIAAARRAHVDVCIGMARRDERGALRNEALYIDRDGRTLARYAKIFLWNFDARWFTPGNAPCTFETRFGTLGVMICADGRMPEIARTLARRGAWLVLDPTAWVGNGRAYDAMANPQVDYLMRVRARENAVWIAAADKCGSELESVHYVGRSMIVAPDGSLVARAPADAPSIVAARAKMHDAAPYVAALDANERAALRSMGTRRNNANGHVVRIGVLQGNGAGHIAAVAALSAQGIDVLLETSRSDKAIAATLRRVRGARFATIDNERMFAPEPARAAALRGADALVWTRAPDRVEVRDVARARALENRVYVIACAQPGRSSTSLVVDPEGRVVAEALTNRDSGFAATIDPRFARDKIVVPGTDVFAARVPRSFASFDERSSRS